MQDRAAHLPARPGRRGARAGGVPLSARPQTIGGYTLGRELGRGGMGVVYAATHPTRGEVALKLLLADTLADPGAHERFAREAQAVGRLDHSGLVRVVDAGREGVTPYVVMGFVTGEPLDVRLRHGPLPEEEAARLAEGLAHALGHAHQRGVLHRDVKPRNVIVDPTGAPVLVDFGLARVARADRITVTGELIGTPAYMAPEQASGASAVGPAADVYGLGATLYEMLAGAPPFVGSTVVNVLARVLDERPAPPSQRRPGLDPALERLVLTCLEKDPAARPSIDALALALAAWRRGRPRRGRATRRRGARAIGALLIVGALTATFVVASTRSDPPEQPPASLPPPVVSSPTTPDPPPSETAAVSSSQLQAQALCMRALRHVEDLDFAGAGERLAEAEALAPTSGQVWFTKAVLHHKTGENAAALVELEYARDREDTQQDLPTLDLLQGSILNQLEGRRAEALPFFERAYRANPDAASPLLCLNYGSALRDVRSREPEAIEPLRRAVASGLFGWLAHFHLGGALRSAQQYDAAVEEFRRARASKNYGGYYAHLREAETQLERGRPAEALAVLRTLDEAENPDLRTNPQFRSALAHALVRQGQPEEALRHADIAIEEDAAWLRGHVARVEALIALGRRDEARASFARARELGAKDPDVERLSAELGP